MPILGIQSSGGMKPSTPTIGTATDGGTGTTVSVAFTPSTYIGKGTISYTATSSPGSLTGTGSGSPITVSGLTTGTAYTFTVRGTTNYGVASDSSAASNSVTPAVPTAFDSIATFTGNGSASTYTFSSIPSTYKSLQLRIVAFGNGASGIQMQINGDTGANYVRHVMRADGGSVSANWTTADTKIDILNSFSRGTDTTFPAIQIVDIIDYASTTKRKNVKVVSGIDGNTGLGQLELVSGLWNNTSAINSIRIFLPSGSFTSGTSIALYGVN